MQRFWDKWALPVIGVILVVIVVWSVASFK
jgi:hypothetical protein